jgi:hypothetical protein
MKNIVEVLKFIATTFLLLATSAANAEDVLGYLTDRYTGPSVEDNIVAMDTDKNGFADVLEVRAFLELKHGKGYESALLDRWELHSQGSSCHAPFVKDVYVDKSNSTENRN